MAEEKEINLDETIDPPDHQGGGGEAGTSLTNEEATTIDPPDHQGGGGG